MSEPADTQSRLNGPQIAETLQQIATIVAQPQLFIEESAYLAAALRGPRQEEFNAEAYRASVARADNAKQTGGYGYLVDSNGIATFQISGTITPVEYAWGDSGETITEWVARDVLAAAADPSVRGGFVINSSPGGYVVGAYEMADAFAAFAAAKPIETFATGICASAAYLNAAMTSRITAYKTTLVGSIGTRSAVIDAHRLFENFGVKMIPIDSGGMKSAGLIGTAITDEQIAYFKDRTSKLNSLFTAAVQSGRSLSDEQLAAVANGKVFTAAEAQSLKLIDAVGTMDSAYAGLAARAAASKPARGVRQDDPTPPPTQTTEPPAAAEAVGDVPEPAATPPAPNQEADMADSVKTPEKANEPQPATIKQLREEFADDPTFALEAADKAWTMTEAKAEYCDRLRQQRKQERAETPPAGGRGSRPVESGPVRRQGQQARQGDAVAEYENAVAEQMDKPGFEGQRKKAVAAVNKRDPDLHRSYLEANNPGRKSRELIADKFDGQ